MLKITAYLAKKPELIKNMEYKHDYDIPVLNNVGTHFFIEIGAGDFMIVDIQTKRKLV